MRLRVVLLFLTPVLLVPLRMEVAARLMCFFAIFRMRTAGASLWAPGNPPTRITTLPLVSLTVLPPPLPPPVLRFLRPPRLRGGICLRYWLTIVARSILAPPHSILSLSLSRSARWGALTATVNPGPYPPAFYMGVPTRTPWTKQPTGQLRSITLSLSEFRSILNLRVPFIKGNTTWGLKSGMMAHTESEALR